MESNNTASRDDDEQTAEQTTPTSVKRPRTKREVTGIKILNHWKKIFDDSGIDEEERIKLMKTLNRLTIKKSKEITKELAKNPDICILISLTCDQNVAFNHITKLIINKKSVNTRQKLEKTCISTSFCGNPSHYILTEYKSPNASINKATPRNKVDDSEILVEFMQKDLPEYMKKETLNKANNIANNFLNNTSFTATETVNMLKQTAECILHSFPFQKERIIRLFKHLIFHTKYPAKEFEDSFTLCQNTTNGNICFNLQHNIIHKYVGIFIQPLPVLPKYPHVSEKLSANGCIENSSVLVVKSENTESSLSPIEKDNTLLISSNVDKDEDVKNISKTMKNEYDNMEEKNEEDEEDEEAFLKRKNAEEEKENNQNFKILEEIQKSNLTETKLCSSDDAVNKLWEKIKNEYFDTLPKEMRDKQNELKEIICHMVYGGKLVEFLKERADWNSISKNGEKYISSKVGKPCPGFEDKSRHAQSQIKPFIGYCFEITKMVNYVHRYEEEMNIKLNPIEEIETKLKILSNFLSDNFVSQITDKGFVSEENDEEWAYNIRPITIIRSAEVFVDYVCYLLAKHSETSINDLKKDLKNSEFHLNNIPNYRHHLVFYRYRRGMYMRSAMNFVIGKRDKSDINFDSEEFVKLKASYVVANIVALGVALKYFGVFPKTKVGFSLSGKQNSKGYQNSVEKKRITIVRDLWPIMKPDLLVFLNKFEIQTIMDLQYVVFIMFLHESKWHISSILQKPKNKLINPTPGIRLKNVAFCTEENKTCVTIVDCTDNKKTNGGKKVKCVCNGHKWCLACLLIVLLRLRQAFVSPLEVTEKGSFTVCPTKHEEFLFTQPDYSGRLQVNRCLSISKATKIIDIFAETLKIPRSYIAFKSFRKAKLIQESIDIVQRNNDVDSLQQVIKLLCPKGYLYPDSLLNQLIYGSNNFLSALQNYRTQRQNGQNVDFADCLKLISDISVGEDFFTPESKLVTEIFDALCPLWSSFSKQLSECVASCRMRMISNELNQFLINFRITNIVHDVNNTSAMNAKTNIDLETIFSYYTYSFTTENDYINPLKCPMCNFCATANKLHKEHVISHKCLKIPCTACKEDHDTGKSYKTPEDAYLNWLKHLNFCHKFTHICRYCNLFIPKSRIGSCLRNNHNVVNACELRIHWKTEKAANENI